MHLVSVIIPCFKNKNTLERAIRSLINQTYQFIEIVVVNDFPDEMEEIKLIVSKYPKAKFFYNTKNSGPSKTRNYGVSKSKGEVIAFLDADDEYHPRKLELQLRELKPDNVVTCGLKKIGLKGHITYSKRDMREIISPKSLIFRNKLNGAGLICFKKLFLDVGGYDEIIKVNEDWDFWFKILSKVKVIDIGKPLYIYHQNAKGITSNKNKIAFWEIVGINHFFKYIKKSQTNFFLKERVFFFRFLILLHRDEVSKSTNTNTFKEINLCNHIRPALKNLIFLIYKLRIFRFIIFCNKPKKNIKLSNKKHGTQRFFLENQTTQYSLILKYRKPKLIAITGGTGFVGSELVKKCVAHGWRVRVLTRNHKSVPNNPHVEFYFGDLVTTRNWSKFIKNVDVIINCAGAVHENKKFYDVNVKGPTRLLNSSIGKVKRWVQLSSAGVYDLNSGITVNEKSLLLAETPYEKSKLEFDKILQKVSRKNKLNILILRPTNIFGVNMTNRSLSELVMAIRKKIFFFFGNFENRLNFIHVHDVVHALMLCSVAPQKTNKIYNISNDIAIKKLVKIVSQASNEQPPRLNIPFFIVKPFVILSGWVPYSLLNLSRLKILINKTKFSSNYIKKDLGFKSTVSVEKGLYSFVKHLL